MMNIIITGKVDIGKTAVCSKLLELLTKADHNCGGILSLKDSNGNIEVYDINSKKKALLAYFTHSELANGPKIGRYSFNKKGIEFGNKAIINTVNLEVLFIDELGYLELKDEGFKSAIKFIEKAKNKYVILVIRDILLKQFLDKINLKFKVFEITELNRNEMPKIIYSYIKQDRQHLGLL